MEKCEKNKARIMEAYGTNVLGFKNRDGKLVFLGQIVFISGLERCHGCTFIIV